jgi:zinc protease
MEVKDMGIFRSELFVFLSIAVAAQTPSGRPVESVLADYVKAVGGQEAVDRFDSREIVVDVRHGKDLTFYWQKPNHVLSATKRERIGYDGTRCWSLSSKNKLKKLARGAELPLEMEANPLRFVHLNDLYSEVNSAAAEEIDGEKMDVLVAPNSLAATKLYFDAKTHLLRRVEEKGEISAYFTNTFDYLDYEEVDGVRMPYRIVHTTTEPQGHNEDLRFKEIKHNVTLQAELFSKPTPGQVVLGGKR